MAFNVLAIVGSKIPTAKKTESVNVQVVQVSDRQGKVENRVEARLFVDDPQGYTGPTKTALVFDNVAQIDDLIAALTAAKGQVALGTLAPVPVAPAKVRVRKANPVARKAARIATV